jgi:hypothetical protein
MIDISFEVNGNALESAMIQSVQDSISKAFGSARCPDHGQKPKIKVKGHNLDSLKFEVSGCCDSLIEEVKRKLK